MTANLNFDDDEKGRPLNQPNFYLETSSMTPEVKFSSKKMVNIIKIFHLIILLLALLRFKLK